MDYGVPFRVVMNESGSTIVHTGACKLTGLYCATVGKTDLPTDPPPEVPEDAAPVVVSVSPVNGPNSTTISIKGTGFGPVKGPLGWAAVGEDGVFVQTWSDTEIVAATSLANNTPGVPVPVVVANSKGVESNADVMFTNDALPPVVASVSPVSGEPGATVTITGTGFGATQGAGKAQIGGFDLLGITWGDTQISGSANIGFGSFDVPVAVVVTNNAGVASNADVMFTFTEPIPVVEISGSSPASGPDGTEITLTGYGFGATQGSGWVNVGAEGAGAYISWSDTQIVIVAAQGAIPLDVAQMIQVQIDPSLGSHQSAPFDGFTFTTAAARGSSKKAAKKTTKREVKVEEPKVEEKPKVTERPKVEERVEAKATGTFPTFESGGGFMLQDSFYKKIFLGPTELKGGQYYPIDMTCSHGLEFVNEGPCDVTLFLVR